MQLYPDCIVFVARFIRFVARFALWLYFYTLGEGGEDSFVFLGGRDRDLREQIGETLRKAGFRVEVHANPGLQGMSAPFTREDAARKLTQLVVHERRERFERLFLASRPISEQSGDLAFRRHERC